MADVGVSLNVKRLFFDRKAVIALIGKQEARFLSKAGAFVRTRARSSLRRRKRISMPGETPSIHSRDSFASLKTILFALEPSRHSVVIGPVKLNLTSAFRSGFVTGAVPGILEHGGQVGIRKVRGRDGKWTRIPFGQKRRGTHLVPVWKATPAEKAASLGIETVRKGKRALNFYRVPAQAAEPSRIIWSKIAPRPFMGPALAKEAPNFPALWANSAGKAAA